MNDDAPQGMDKVHDICSEMLNDRMVEARDLIDSAAECLFRHDYQQAAARLEMLVKIGSFTQTELKILEAASSDATQRRVV